MNPSAGVPGRRGFGLGLGLGLLVLALGLVALSSLWPARGDPEASAPRTSPAGGVVGDAKMASGAGTSGAGPGAEPGSGFLGSGVGVVGGRLVDPASGPLGEGRVDLVCVGGARVGQARVDEEGRFAGPACAEGPTCARLVHPVFVQGSPWTLARGRFAELEPQPAPRVWGRVALRSGEPVAAATLILRAGERRATGSTDATGEFALSLPGLRPCDACDDAGDGRNCDSGTAARAEDHAVLQVEAADIAPMDVTTELAGFASVEVEVAGALGVVRGRVSDARGRSFPGRTSVILSSTERPEQRRAQQLGPEGEFELAAMTAGPSHELRVIRDGRELGRASGLAPGEVLDLELEVLAEVVDLELELRDPEGTLASSVRVEGGPFRAAQTDDSGRVEAQDVLPGRYSLWLQAPGCERIRVELELDPPVPGSRGARVRSGLVVPALRCVEP